jgi:hypothetical protein
MEESLGYQVAPVLETLLCNLRDCLIFSGHKIQMWWFCCWVKDEPFNVRWDCSGTILQRFLFSGS